MPSLASGGFCRRLFGSRPPGSRFFLAIGQYLHRLIVAARQAAESVRCVFPPDPANKSPAAHFPGSVRRRPCAHHPTVFRHAALENSSFNCLNRSPYLRSQSKRLPSMTKSSLSSLVESTGETSTDRYEIDTVCVLCGPDSSNRTPAGPFGHQRHDPDPTRNAFFIMADQIGGEKFRHKSLSFQGLWLINIMLGIYFGR
jgi:hypothetical protein